MGLGRRGRLGGTLRGCGGILAVLLLRLRGPLSLPALHLQRKRQARIQDSRMRQGVREGPHEASRALWKTEITMLTNREVLTAPFATLGRGGAMASAR